MTTYKQNATLCLLGGWVKKRFTWVTACGSKMSGDYWLGDEGEILRKMPDIRNDLNLLNRIERKLTPQQHKEFRVKLNNFPLSDRDYVSAEGPQRAEAILQALKLWK